MAKKRRVKLGRKPLDPNDPLVHKGFRLPQSLVEGLAAAARGAGQTESHFLRVLLEETLTRLGDMRANAG